MHGSLLLKGTVFGSRANRVRARVQRGVFGKDRVKLVRSWLFTGGRSGLRFEGFVVVMM